MLTDDTPTKLDHVQAVADCLQVPLAELLEATPLGCPYGELKRAAEVIQAQQAARAVRAAKAAAKAAAFGRWPKWIRGGA